MASDKSEGGLEGLDEGRRAFIKRMAATAAVVPVVTSFSMTGLNATAAFAGQGSNQSPGNGPPGNGSNQFPQ